MAQKRIDLKFKNFTVKDGLIHNMVNQCVMDKKGFLWLATEGGLSRFDGVNFKNFEQLNADTINLSSSILTHISLDNENQLWIASKNGLFSFDVISEKLKKINFSEAIGNVKGLAIDTLNHCVWFVNLDLQSLCCFDYKNQKIESFFHKDIIEIENIQLFEKNIFIAADRSGLLKLDVSKKEIKNIFPNHWILSFYNDNGKLWVGTWQDSLYQYLPKTEKLKGFLLEGIDNFEPYQLIQHSITKVPSFNKDGFLWIATSTDGLIYYDENNQKIITQYKYDTKAKQGINSDFLNYLYNDKYGNLWVCSWYGLMLLNPNDQEFTTFQYDFLNVRDYNLVSGIIRDKKDPNILWIGANGRGISKFNEKENKLIKTYFKYQYNSKESNYDDMWTEFIQIDSKNRKWGGSYAGLICIEDDKPKVFDLYFNDQKNYCYAHRMYQENEKTFWVTTSNGLFKFNPENGKYKVYLNDTLDKNSISNNRIIDVYPYINQSLLVVTKKGIDQFFPSENKFIHLFNTKDQKDIKKIENATKGKNDEIYFSSKNAIFIFYPKTKTIEKIKYSKAIIPVFNNTMSIDNDGKLWVYASDALYCYNPVDKSIHSYTQKEGLYTNNPDPSHLFWFENNLHIGYRMGYTKFNPSQVNTNKNKAKPYITNIDFFNVSQNIIPDSFINNALNISYKNNEISFDFTAIDYTFSDRILFQYKLEGYDKTWINTGTKRSATYTNLDGGNYTFKVKACNSSLIWNPETAQFKIHIVPPFWEAWWFRILIVLIVFLIVYLIVKNRIDTIKKDEKLNTEFNKKIAELESKALRSQMNPHFIFNSLNSIQSYIQRNDKENSSRYLSKFARLTRLILDHSQHQFISIENEITALKIYLELEQFRFTNKFEFEINIAENIDVVNTEIPPLILQPYIENAIWHGIMHKENGNGLIEINLTKEKDCLIAEIKDNGVGRKKAQNFKSKNITSHQSTGMRVTNERLEILNKNNDLKVLTSIIDLEDIEGNSEGTLVTILIPLSHD